MNRICNVLQSIFILLIFLYTINTAVAVENDIITSIHCDISTLDGKKQSTIYTDNTNISFLMNLSVTTNTRQNFIVKIMSNFEFVPFSLNDSDYLIEQCFNLLPSIDPMVSTKNVITIKNITHQTNEVCIFIIGEHAIYLHRIVVINANSKSFYEYPIIDLVNTRNDIKYESSFFSNIIYENNLPQNVLCINYDKIFEGSSFETQYKSNLDEKITYALIKVDKQGNLCGSPEFITCDHRYFYFDFDKITYNKSLYYVLFPFIYSYSEEFPYTYRQVMWSSPLTLFIPYSD